MSHPSEGDYLELIHRILSRYGVASIEASRALLHLGNVATARKNDVVFHENRFNAFEYFQLTGVSHRFNQGNDKYPVTTGIYQSEAVVTPHFARTPNGQSLFSLQALTDCTYLQIPAGAFHELRERDTAIRNFGRAVVEKEFMQSLQFEVLFRANDAKDRLRFFREYYPGLENIIPHTVIASFLGITPVSFSRLRKDLMGK